MKVILDETDIEKFIKEKYPTATDIVLPKKISITIMLAELPRESTIPVNVKIEALDRSKELAARGSTNTVPEKDYVRTNSGSIDADASGLTTLNYGEKAPVGGEMSSRRGVLPRVG